jgi:CheY-like chemotaxis protein
MDTTSSTIGFAGDLDDPWVAEIARALSEFDPIPWGRTGADLPREAFRTQAGVGVGILVLHRTRLTGADVARLEELRREAGPGGWPRIILCVSPYVRYAEIERCAGLVELVVPEATAAETLPRKLERMLGKASPRARRAADGLPVEVVSGDFELRQVLREACARAGYRTADAASLAADPDAELPGDGPRLTVWDVPVLEPSWEERLERRGRLGPVLALLGFADRSAVTQARNAGAAACLDLPCAMDDLIDALDRLARLAARPRAQLAHPTPPAPARSTRGRSRAARRLQAGAE